MAIKSQLTAVLLLVAALPISGVAAPNTTSCVQSLCGEASQVPNIANAFELRKKQLSGVPMTWAKSEYLPVLKSVFKEALQNSLDRLLRLQALSNSKTPIRLNQSWKRELLARDIFAKLGQNQYEGDLTDMFEITPFNGRLVISFKYSSLLSSVKGPERLAAQFILESQIIPLKLLTITAQTRIGEPMAELLRYYENRSQSNVRNYPAGSAEFKILDRSQYKNVADLARDVWAQIYALQTAMDPLAFKLRFQDDSRMIQLVQAISNGAALEKKEAAQIARFAIKVKFLHAIHVGVLKDTLDTILKANPKAAPSIAVIENAKVKLKLSLDNLIQYKRTEIKGADAQFSSISGNLEAVLISQLQTGVFLSEQNLLRNNIEQIKAASKIVLKKYLDNEDLALATQFMDEVRFEMPESNEAKQKNKLSTLQNFSDRFKAEAAAAKTSPAGAEYDQYLLFSVLNQNALLENDTFDPDLNVAWKGQDLILPELAIFQGLQSNFQNENEAVTDYSIPGFKVISLSWFTAAFPQYGVGIAAHEVGHLVSGLIRNMGSREVNRPRAEKFRESLSCVANRNIFLQSPLELWGATKGTSENSQWSEEDWADHFASQVLIELQSRNLVESKYLQNFGCALVYKKSGDAEAKLEPSPGAVHSSGLLRLLTIARDTGKSTELCGGLLQQALPAEKNPMCK